LEFVRDARIHVAVLESDGTAMQTGKFDLRLTCAPGWTGGGTSRTIAVSSGDVVGVSAGIWRAYLADQQTGARVSDTLSLVVDASGARACSVNSEEGRNEELFERGAPVETATFHVLGRTLVIRVFDKTGRIVPSTHVRVEDADAADTFERRYMEQPDEVALAPGGRAVILVTGRRAPPDRSFRVLSDERGEAMLRGWLPDRVLISPMDPPFVPEFTPAVVSDGNCVVDVMVRRGGVVRAQIGPGLGRCVLEGVDSATFRLLTPEHDHEVVAPGRYRIRRCRLPRRSPDELVVVPPFAVDEGSESVFDLTTVPPVARDHLYFGSGPLTSALFCREPAIDGPYVRVSDGCVAFDKSWPMNEYRYEFTWTEVSGVIHSHDVTVPASDQSTEAISEFHHDLAYEGFTLRAKFVDAPPLSSVVLVGNSVSAPFASAHTVRIPSVAAGQEVEITGLPAGTYSFCIDGDEEGRITASPPSIDVPSEAPAEVRFADSTVEVLVEGHLPAPDPAVPFAPQVRLVRLDASPGIPLAAIMRAGRTVHFTGVTDGEYEIQVVHPGKVDGMYHVWGPVLARRRVVVGPASRSFTIATD
jgi:hypothetical protein